MDKNGNIYVSKFQEIGKFHHSSIVGGEPVAGAVEMTARKGVLTELSNKSGHYHPTKEINSQVLDQISSEGVNVVNIDITGY